MKLFHWAPVALGTILAIVTAGGAEAAALDDATAGFARYVLAQTGESLAGARALRDAVAAGDLGKAQAAWRAARGGWERSEIVAGEYFPELDDAIDSWPSAKTGFHAIEAKLFGAHQLDVLPLAEALVANLTEFDRKLRATTLSAQGLLNGTTRLIYEVGENKANGGESQFSGSSLEDMSDNVAGIDAAYRTIFAPLLQERSPALAAAVQSAITHLQTLVKAPDLRSLDQTALRQVSEELAAILQTAAPEIGLERPALED